MEANLDSKIELLRLKSLSCKSLDIETGFDDVFLEINEKILAEADEIRNKPAVYTINGKTQKKKDRLILVNVESMMSDNNDTFIKNVYRKVLGREPDQNGYDSIMQQLKSKPDFDRESIIYNCWKSEEGRKKNIEVVGFHKVYLHDLIQYDRKDFIEHCFLQLLGRRPNQNEIDSYLGMLDSFTLSREEVIRYINESDEGKRRQVEVVGFAGMSRRYKVKESLMSIPVLGNACFAIWNLLHINRRLKEINSRIAGLYNLSRQYDEDLSEYVDKKVKAVAVEEEEKYNQICEDRQKKYLELSEEINIIKQTSKELKEAAEGLSKRTDALEGRTDKLNVQYNHLLDPAGDIKYLERLNHLLSGRMTLWGPEERLHISKKSAVYTCFFNTNSGDITIGDYTFAGSNVSLLAGSHDKNLGGLLRRDVYEVEGFDITIGNGVWLGSGCTVLGPVTIGDNAIIAAGAVVVPGTAVPANTVYGGVPAKQIGDELVIAKDFSNSIMHALEIKKGILFTEGWSEEAVISFKGENVIGHYLYEESGKVLIEPGLYSVNYVFEEKEPVELQITGDDLNVKHVLSHTEESIVLEIKGDKCGYISFSGPSEEKHFGIFIEKINPGEKNI